MMLTTIAIILAASALAAGGPAPGDSTGIHLPEYAGRQLRFISPDDGQEVVAGDSLLISLSVPDGVEFETILVASTGMFYPLRKPFRVMTLIDESTIGKMTFKALGKTTTDELMASYDVTIDVVSAGKLLEIAAWQPPERIYGVGRIESLYIRGRYEGGVERWITDHGTSYAVASGADVVCVTDDGIIVARKTGGAVVRVSHGDFAIELPIIVEDGPRLNNPPLAALPDLVEGRPGQEICLDASAVRDLDECLGEMLDPALMHWKLEFNDRVYEGDGYEFCFTPEDPGDGAVYFDVTDPHGATSQTFAMIEVR